MNERRLTFEEVYHLLSMHPDEILDLECMEFDDDGRIGWEQFLHCVETFWPEWARAAREESGL